MSLSNDLISQFVKVANSDKKETKKETIVYGTVSKVDGSELYVRLDGASAYSELPIISTVEAAEGDRVIVMIKNHSAVITGNLTAQAAGDQVRANAATAVSAANDASNKVTQLGIVIADKVDTDTFTARVGAIERLETDCILTQKVKANEGNITDLQAEDVTIKGRLDAAEASITDLNTDRLKASEAEITYAKITDLDVTNENVGNLDADVANINTLIFGSATGKVVQAEFANQVIAHIGTAQIKDAMIDTVSAGKLTALNLLAGTINSDNVNISSSDGRMQIADNAITIKDANRVRVQIGKDGTGDYSINIIDADGNIMFSEGGITDKAITDAIIRNDMVSDNANIHASKLDIDSLFEEINSDGTNVIKSTKITVDEQGQTLDAAFKKMATTESVDNLSKTVSSQGTQIQANTEAISTKVWQQDINTATDSMSTQYSTLQQDLDDYKTTVGNTYATKTALTAAETAIAQNTDKISLTVEELSISGRNLLIRRGELLDTYVYPDGSVGDADTAYKSATMINYIRVEPGATYTFSKSDVSSNYYFRWAWYTEDLLTIGRTADNTNTIIWTAPSNAAYVKISYPYIDGANAKFEKGSEATEFCLAVEDIDANFDNYSTTAEMNAAIQLESNSIISSVSSTYVTKSEVDNMVIGSVNLIKNSNFKDSFNDWVAVGVTYDIIEDSDHGTCLMFSSSEAGSSNYRVYPSTTENFTHTPNTTYSLSFYAKADTTTTIQANVSGSYSAAFEHTVTTEWQRITRTYIPSSGGSLTFWVTDANIPVYITKVQVEHGTKVTDWSPSPEDMATNARVESAETKITQNSNSITSQASSITSLGTRMSTVEQTADGLTVRLNTTDTNINNAAKTATNYLNYSSSGLIVGDHTGDTLGNNIRISSGTVDIRNGDTIYASYGANTIYLGKNSETAVINLCNGSATMRSVDDYDFKIYTDKRLVMSAYQSALIDCNRATGTARTMLSIQSYDPDNTYFWGGVSCSIYQESIQNDFDMSGNTTKLKITDGTNESEVYLDETKFKITANNAQVNCTNGLYIGYDGDYKPVITLGYDPLQSKSIRWYWSDYELHDAFSNGNGQITYVGPGDIGETTTTMVRGQYVRLYAHSGGAVYLGYSGSTAVTSDRNMKTDIYDIDDRYLDFFDRLRPITYKYDAPGNKGHRDHVGFIAQEVEEALIASGLTTEEFAGLIIEKDVTLNANYDSSMTDEEIAANEVHYDELYSLRYEEFISLLVKKVQSLQEQINQLRSN